MNSRRAITPLPEPVPPGLVPQIPVIDGVLRAIGIDVIGVPGYEAEDVIATLAAQISGTVEIATGDRDLFALVEDPLLLGLGVADLGDDQADQARLGGDGERAHVPHYLAAGAAEWVADRAADGGSRRPAGEGGSGSAGDSRSHMARVGLG